MKFVCSSPTLSFLLFSFITNLSPSSSFAAADDGRYIIDTNFLPVHPDGRYYIIPSLYGISSGRVKLEKTGDSKCPVTVLEQDFTDERGIAVKFSPIGTNYDILTDMQTLNGTFFIRKSGLNTYKFVFCENGSSTSCSDIRWYNNFEGGGRLSLTGQDVSTFVFVETYSYEYQFMKSIA
ncbi:hypothetical protein P8452_51283 [Trifolium repens]|nr:hypothetical protein P8452_51283 [Trifolium repens]